MGKQLARHWTRGQGSLIAVVRALNYEFAMYTQKMPAAMMYFAFFAVGVLSGTMLKGGKKGGASGKSKPQK
jgi:hypothetical protein